MCLLKQPHRLCVLCIKPSGLLPSKGRRESISLKRPAQLLSQKHTHLCPAFAPCSPLPSSLPSQCRGNCSSRVCREQESFFLPILSSGLPLPLTGKFQGEFLEWNHGGEFLALVFSLEAVLVRRGREHLSQTIRPCQAVSQTGFCIQ